MTLSGTASDDDPGDNLTYSWIHDSALTITITGSDSLSASFTAPDVAANTTITVTLTVSDGTVDVSDALQVTIADSPSIPPAADAGLNLAAAGSITGAGTLELLGARAITTLESGGSTYAAVASSQDDGVQILRLTGGAPTATLDSPPTVTSIERSDPAGETTSAQTLVFAVTFSEDVSGVDAGDFALSPDSTGGGSAFGQFTQASTPELAIPDNARSVSDTITVPDSGTATSVSVAVDISHTRIGDLVVELVAPDGTARTLHDRSGGNADGVEQTYTPDFGGTGIAGDWALRASDGAPGDACTLNGWTLTIGHDGAGGSVTGLAGSGSQYLVTVSAPQEGTYNLDVIQDSGIADVAGNPLADAAPTGADHTYTRTGP